MEHKLLCSINYKIKLVKEFTHNSYGHTKKLVFTSKITMGKK